jgi:hypothetical protein
MPTIGKVVRFSGTSGALSDTVVVVADWVTAMALGCAVEEDVSALPVVFLVMGSSRLRGWRVVVVQQRAWPECGPGQDCQNT